jgi:hypothetical protein
MRDIGFLIVAVKVFGVPAAASPHADHLLSLVGNDSKQKT